MKETDWSPSGKTYKGDKIPRGSEPVTTAITGLNGAFVQLDWINLGPAPRTARYDVLRDDVIIATYSGTGVAHRDTTVASGSNYIYKVRYFS